MVLSAKVDCVTFVHRHHPPEISKTDRQGAPLDPGPQQQHCCSPFDIMSNPSLDPSLTGRPDPVHPSSHTASSTMTTMDRNQSPGGEVSTVGPRSTSLVFHPSTLSNSTPQLSSSSAHPPPPFLCLHHLEMLFNQPDWSNPQSFNQNRSLSTSNFDHLVQTFSLPIAEDVAGYSSSSRPPTSAEIDAVIAAAIANAPPAPAPPEMDRSNTPLMTNLLPSAVGADGRVNLFVGNLPYRVRWQDLKDLFRKAGTVLRADVSLGPDNRSRGYGTVLMGSREDAARAIDRFNGFTWQTRTLEVRPDRLPPEYEPQPHPSHHHGVPRPPIFPYQNLPHPSHGPGHPHAPPQHPSFSLPTHLAPGHGPAWNSAPIGRPPPPGAHPLQHHFSLPSHGLPPSHSHQLGGTGSSPNLLSSSPRSGYGSGGLPLPLMGQNSGPGMQAIGASPLAGSLTAGSGSGPNSSAASVSGVNPARRDSLSPFAHAITPDSGVPAAAGPQSSSPALGSASGTRPSSGSGRQAAPSPNKLEGLNGRSGSLGSLASLPPPLFAGVKSVIASSEGVETGIGSQSTSAGSTPLPGKANAPAPGPPVAIAMEGLSHQGAHMGPPSTLHDRVVFVSKLPLSMQWQELKDLLRPAGLIIRADVATDSEGRPRGFGTALFATEQDAAKAVVMFNDRDISGHRIRVSLERDIVSESISRRGSTAVSTLSFHDNQSAHENGQSSSETGAPSVSNSSDTATSGRVPWSLNIGGSGKDVKSPRQRPGQETSATPQHSHRHHHPGPIAMPTFAPLDAPGQNPLSPLQTRGLPPMTPSMPGFVFNAYPETPPVHAPFMSPGFGPFSPGLPVTSPTGFQYNPFLNPAPGAPVNRFPQGGSAALGTPTTQSFPANPVHGYGDNAGPIGAPGQRPQPSIGQIGDYFPVMGNGFNNSASQNGNGDPASPTPRTSNSSRSIAPSPLNAKDRLASTSSSEVTAKDGPGIVGDLADRTGKLNLSPGRGLASPNGKTARVGGDGPEGHGADTSAPVSARASIDGIRPNLGVWDINNGERRASFGDVVAGRAKE
ncbi:hypothetical protein DB88DRAFT_468638 [Papiliotrema laurentii]|uniref:RRM domain-containing protein n=1 Tax=Papiliotrema laurentii TaxID=5418 RepID=A0AAD9CSW7_PAPLA|nr:hypothetical protein DB88DRAFT_468638 [Papiliotrema laurentii]